MRNKVLVCDDHKEAVIAHKIWRYASPNTLGMPNFVKSVLMPNQVISVVDPYDCQLCRHPGLFQRDN